MRDDSYFRETCKKIIDTREWAGVELGRLGFSFPESGANFLFVTHKKKPAREICDALRARHIYVRYFDAPRTDNYLRITIGTDDEMDKLVEFCKRYVEDAMA